MKKMVLILLVVVIGLGSYLLWQRHKSEARADKYRTEKVEIGTIVQTVAATGALNPVTLVTVGTQISGKVQKINVDFNDRVTKGQVLLELDPKILVANLEQSAAGVKKAQASLDLAIANEKRGQLLYKTKDLSRQDFEQLQQIRKSAAADLENAKAQMDSDKTNLSYATIVSPVSGVVVDREVDVGQTVAASFQTPVLFKIAENLVKMQIDSSYAEADIGNIKPGQAAIFTVDAYPERKFNGVVKQIRLNPTIQQNVVTYDVVVLVDNPDGVLLPGMTAYVNITTAEHKDVLMVPNSALRFKPHRQGKTEIAKAAPGMGTVYKSVDGRAEAVICKLGITDNKNTEITSDQLKVDDVIIIDEKTTSGETPSSGMRFRMF
jgi:HlyD family secretion protein